MKKIKQLKIILIIYLLIALVAKGFNVYNLMAYIHLDGIKVGIMQYIGIMFIYVIGIIGVLLLNRMIIIIYTLCFAITTTWFSIQSVIGLIDYTNQNATLLPTSIYSQYAIGISYSIIGVILSIRLIKVMSEYAISDESDLLYEA